MNHFRAVPAGKAAVIKETLLYVENKICRYLILSADPAARNSKPLLWEAASPGALIAKAKTCRSRCLFLPIGAAAIPLHPEIRAAARAVPAVPAQTAAHVTSQNHN